ncbi:hypothetical protein J3B02_002343 [Coemansia erecta]|uniref:Uncharacterized protein n=1 Tax=Coemansia asiatica TaxID=1052880 RepID=A0A9W8CKY8_9FUNG|nr:hypothetical protein LPJ64_000389 [Coemansia asiatica]KAJ2855096.1 hypothetical protein J3B02_002343 [Coemansia erecta]KAJ2881118.1 hypothetical protein FB639_002688 [Coemansia asiatica]
MLVSGLLIGASSALLYNRYRLRRLHKRQTKGDIIYEEYETQLTAAEKHVLHKISSADGALSLTLKLPDTTLGMSLTPAAVSAASVCGSEKSLMSRSAVSLVSSTKPEPLCVVSGLSQSQAADNNNGAKTPSIKSSSNSSRSVCKSGNLSCPQEEQPLTPTAVRQQPQPDNKQSVSDSSLRGLGLGFGVRIASENARVGGPTSTDDAGSSHAGAGAGADTMISANGCSATENVAGPQSTPTTIKPHARRPSAMVITAVKWSSPVDDKTRRRTYSRPKNDSIDSISNGSNNSSSSFDKSQKVYSACKLPSDYPLPSANSSTLEAISSINTPISPRTLASPCGSTDYVFIPPSPSISSLYEVSIQEGTLSPHQGSLLVNARSAGVAKSASSPGSLPSVHSLFSPPPVHYHQRYFESHRMPQSPSLLRVKKSLDHLASK